MPFLDGGGDGFVRVLTRETPTGAQYKNLYTDQMMRVILFERPDTSGKSYRYGDLLALRDVLIAPDVMQGDPFMLICGGQPSNRCPSIIRLACFYSMTRAR